MKTRKLFAFLLAAVMVLSLTVTAFATNSDPTSFDKGSITVKNPIEGQTYKVYKIFDTTYDLGSDGKPGESSTDPTTKDKYAYTIASDWVDDVIGYATPKTGLPTTWNSITANGLTVSKAIDTAGNVMAYNVTFDKDTFSAADFGEKMALKTTGKTTGITLTTDATHDKPYADNLDLGYYMLQPSAANALVSLTTTDADVIVADKNEKPEVDKKITDKDGIPLEILDCKDSTHDGTTVLHSDECWKELDHTTASIGDTIPFELETKVPDMTGYETYFFVVNDTMSKGLTFNEDVKVYMGGKTDAHLIANTKYDVKVTDAADGAKTIRIVFKDMLQYWSDVDVDDKAGQPIFVTYSATVNEKSIVGTSGNKNSAKMEYSSDPNVVPEYTPGKTPTYDPVDPEYNFNKPEYTGKNPIEYSVPDVVTIYSTALELTKVDKNDSTKTLTGAKFKIEGEKLGVTIINSYIFERDDTNGEYYRLKNGKYTKDAPIGQGETPVDTYTVVPDTFVRLSYETSAETKAKSGLYYKDSTGNFVPVTSDMITNQTEGLYYVPVYNNLGLYYKSGDTYLEVTESNCAAHLTDTLYSKTSEKESDQYENLNEKYKLVEVINKTNNTETYESEGFVDENGVICFQGLAEGIYKITELRAPDGYNLLKFPLVVTVTLVEDSTTAGKYVFNAVINDNTNSTLSSIGEKDGKLSFKVQNAQGIELPETGGVGTTIFYVLGGICVLAAGIVLITKKRMEANG